MQIMTVSNVNKENNINRTRIISNSNGSGGGTMLQTWNVTCMEWSLKMPLCLYTYNDGTQLSFPLPCMYMSPMVVIQPLVQDSQCASFDKISLYLSQ
jgi:hypothetical protein